MWSDKLNRLNEQLIEIAALHRTVDQGEHDICIDNIPINEQLEILNWMNKGGTWQVWSAFINTQDDTSCFHYILRKGKISLNVGHIYWSSKTDIPLNNLPHDLKNLNAKDNSLLFYCLKMKPLEHIALEDKKELIAKSSNLVVKHLLQIETT